MVRNDVVNQKVMQVDQTFHYVGADGVVRGVARVPLSETYYEKCCDQFLYRESICLLPRPNSLDVVVTDDAGGSKLALGAPSTIS